jgi:transposase
VVNPAGSKGYAASQMRRNKTDKLDAALIADLCRTQQPAAWTPPAPELRQLQQLVRHLDDLIRARQVAQNHLDEQRLAQALVDHWQAQIRLLDSQLEQTE